MATQKEIVEKLGISQSAVSFALSGYRSGYKGGRISQEIKDKVIKEAARLNYKPKTSSKKTKVIALLSDFNKEGVYLPRLMKGVQDFALESSYMVVHHVFSGSKIPEQLISSVDGFIAAELDFCTEMKRIAEIHPLVLLNRRNSDNQSDSVMPDHYNGMRKGIEQLYDMGHRKFAFFGLRTFHLHHAERFGAYNQVISELDLPVPDPAWIFIPFRKERSLNDVDHNVKETLSAIIKMKDRPTALICAADVYALSFIKLAAEMKIRIPQDISIIGFDDIRDCENSAPPLSSITQPLEKMGSIAAKLLIGRINGNVDSPLGIRITTEWKARGSIASPGKW